MRVISNERKGLIDPMISTVPRPGSVAVFAVYHPPLSWLPVALLGATNAVLFKKTGRLTSAVILHMVYNAVIVLS